MEAESQNDNLEKLNSEMICEISTLSDEIKELKSLWVICVNILGTLRSGY